MYSYADPWYYYLACLVIPLLIKITFGTTAKIVTRVAKLAKKVLVDKLQVK